MEDAPHTLSSPEKLGERFLREGPIRWLLATGIILLLGSSLMLVKTHWESIGPFAKYAIFLAYTTCLWVVGDVAYHHRGLRRTGTVFMGLTVVLLPLTFAALAKVQMGLMAGAMLAVHLAIGWHAARRIFRHFLRGEQPTFVASYLTLACSAFFAPKISAPFAPLMLLGLWAVFAAGTLKVNRHVFWLTEEKRLPRVFGFFPILLLAGQYFTIAAIYFVPQISVPWLGVYCELTAVPILLAARTVTEVFRDRTGDLVRPIPWSIMLPLVVGLILVCSGLVLGTSGIATGGTLHAVVPTAVIAAFLLGSVARDTQKSVFVWGMLGGVVLAYNFSPAFFADLARQVVQWGAEAVHEERLPYAFYGLTYLPLLLAVTVLVPRLRRAGSELFAQPLRRFAMAVSIFLLGIAVPEPSARLPVAAAMIGLFALQARCFGDRRLVLLAAVSWILAACGVAPFLKQVFLFPDLGDLVVPTVAAALALLLAVRSIDLSARRLAIPEGVTGLWSHAAPRRWLDHPLASVSLGATVVLAGVWFLGDAVTDDGSESSWWHLLFIGALLVAHALRLTAPRLGFATLAFLVGGGCMVAVSHGFLWEDVMVVAPLLLIGLSYLGGRSRAVVSRWARTFAAPSEQLSRIALPGTLVFVFFPWMLFELLLPEVSSDPGVLAWIGRLAVIGWTLHAAPRYRSRFLAYTGTIAVLLAVGSAGALTESVGRIWLPAVWGAMALLTIHATSRWKNLPLRLFCGPANSARAYLVHPMRSLMRGLAFAIALVGAAFIAWELRVAGLFAIASLVLLRIRPGTLGFLVNWQLLALIAYAATPEAIHFFDYPSLIPDATIVLAFGAALSLLAWQWWAPRLVPERRELVSIHCLLLAGLVLAMTSLSLTLTALWWWEVVLAGGIFAALAAREVVASVRLQREAPAWFALVFVAAGVGFLALHDVIVFRRGWSLLGMFCGSVLLWGIGNAIATTKQARILTRPFRITGELLPAVVGLLGVGRAFFEDPSRWQFYTAAFAAAGFYLWRGIEERRSRFVLAAAAIGNAALLLVWRSLSWDDTQLYLIPVGVSLIGIVQLLRNEIPDRWRDPLRYVGTLIVLVSPVPDIFQGSWTHILSLMLVSVGVVLFALAAKIRVLLALGVAFLAADMVAMVVRGSMERPELLWIAGVGLGTAILLLGAFCEDRRETLRQQMRSLSAAFADWD